MKIVNRPSDLGRDLGGELVRLVEPVMDKAVADARCSSCAFRAGTVPNACLTTAADALKCTLEGWPFFCHMGEKPVCAGWVAARAPMNGQTMRAPWPWSDEMGDA